MLQCMRGSTHMESVFDALALPRASPAEALLARDKDAAYVQRLVDQSFAALSLCGDELAFGAGEVALGVGASAGDLS